MNLFHGLSSESSSHGMLRSVETSASISSQFQKFAISRAAVEGVCHGACAAAMVMMVGSSIVGDWKVVEIEDGFVSKELELELENGKCRA